MRKLFLLFALLLLGAPASEAATRFADPAGSVNAFCTIGVPCEIIHAIEQTGPGDILEIRGGTYTDRLNSNTVAFQSGTSYADAPIFRAYNGETVIFKPTASGGSILNLATSAASPNLKYQIWQDIIFDGNNGVTTGQGVTNGESSVSIGFGNSGVSGPDAHHIRMIRVTARNTQSGNPAIVSNVGNGFQLGDGGSNELLQCRAHNNGNFRDAEGKAGYGVYAGGSDNLVDGCEIFSNGGYGVHQFGSGHSDFDDNLIINNKIYNNSTHSTQFTAGIILSSGSRNAAINNEVSGGQAGIQVASSCTSCTVSGNTVYGAAEAGLYPEGKGTFTNNVVQNSVTAILDGGFPGTPTFTTNACFGNSTSTNCSFTSLNPRFVDATNRDFRLCTGSGAPHPNCTAASGLIDVGTTLGSPANVDMVGTARPIGAGFDIGAHESGATSEPTPAYVGQWSFDNVATDSSGNTNHGTLTGGAAYTAGKYNSGVTLDGVNDYINVEGHVTLDLSNGYTMAAWVNPASAMTTFQTLFYKHSYFFYLSSEAAFCGVAGALMAGIDTGDNATFACYGVPLPDGVMTHVAATYDRTAIKIYINGIMVTSTAASAFMPATVFDLQIGASQFGEYFAGVIDEPHLRNTALTQAEIQTLMATSINSVTGGSTGIRLGTGSLKLGGGSLKLR